MSPTSAQYCNYLCSDAYYLPFAIESTESGFPERLGTARERERRSGVR